MIIPDPKVYRGDIVRVLNRRAARAHGGRWERGVVESISFVEHAGGFVWIYCVVLDRRPGPRPIRVCALRFEVTLEERCGILPVAKEAQ